MSSYGIVVGSMLGIGIFLAPPIVATHLGSSTAFMLVWLLGGVIALSGSVACGELGAMMPRAGGDYVFQYEAFGPSTAFASGWVLFAAIFSGSIATMSVGLCTYQVPVLLGVDTSQISFVLLGIEISRAQLLSLLIIPVLTAINALGARPSARVQMALTAIPVLLLLIIALYAVFAGSPTTAAAAAQSPAPATSLGGLLKAHLAVYFAYSGWINIIYVAGEVERPERNIPRSLIGGTTMVTALYLLLCAAFLRVFGLGGLSGAGEAGTALAAVFWGDGGRTVIALLVAAALLASINATVLGGARVAYAMGQRGATWSFLGAVGQRSKTPQRALWLQGLLSSLLVLSGRFEQLYTSVSLAMVLTGTLTIGSLFVLRWRTPQASRPYRASGYPWFPALYLAASLLTIVGTVSESLAQREYHPLIGLGIMVVAFVLHRLVAGGSKTK